MLRWIYLASLGFVFVSQLVCVSCSRCSSVRGTAEPAASASPVQSASAAAALPSVVAPAPSAPAPSAEPSATAEAPNLCGSSPAKDVQSAQALADAGDWQKARKLLDRAVHVRPLDAAIRLARARALQSLAQYSPARDDLWVAKQVTKDQKLLAEIYFVTGLLQSAEHNAEDARIAFSSAAERGHAGARERLGKESTCRASWKKPTQVELAPLAKTVRELLEARRSSSCKSLPAAQTEAEAAQIICRPCEKADEPATCDDPRQSNLEISEGGDSFARISFVSAPLPGSGGMVYHKEQYYSGAPPSPQWQVSGGHLIEQRETFELAQIDDGLGNLLFVGGANAPMYTQNNEAEAGDRPEPRCQPQGVCPEEEGNGTGAYGSCAGRSNARHETTVYSLTTRRAVLRITAIDGAPTVTVKEGAVHLTGAGCSEVIPLGD